MDKRCHACMHPLSIDIDRAIQAGDSTRKIGARFSLTASCVQRHKRHVSLPPSPHQEIEELRGRIKGLERAVICLSQAHDELVRAHNELI